jgi:CheY-like chemotaxis protein
LHALEGLRQGLKMVSQTAFVIDDSKSARIMLGRMLKKSGIEVSLFESGEDLLQALEHLPPPNLIFMDHMMPGIDGLETTRVLRKQQPYADIPIYMYTSKNEASYAAEIASAGANGVLPKPATPDALLRLVSTEGSDTPEPAPEASSPSESVDAQAVQALMRETKALQRQVLELEEANQSLRSTVSNLVSEGKKPSATESHAQHVTQNAFNAALSQINRQLDEKLSSHGERLTAEISASGIITSEIEAQIKKIAESAAEKAAKVHTPKIAESHAQAVAAKVAAAQAEIVTRKQLEGGSSKGQGTKLLILVCLVLTGFSISLHFIN